MQNIKTPKKLIEVALPLDDINEACAHEKMPGIGPHPRGIHLWWARRPLAAARAMIFSQMVNDPGYQREIGYGSNKLDAEKKREELFSIIRDLVKWDNTTNETVLRRAQEAIEESWRETCRINRNHPDAKIFFDPDKLPAFHDPFAGGGAIPLEAQKLGLESYASDLNPVAVLLNKAMIEIPPRFIGRHPVGPVPRENLQRNLTEDWSGIQGMAEDVRRYGYWILEKAKEQLGHLYPSIKITEEFTKNRPDLKPYENEEVTVIAWLWARTVKSPSPVYSHLEVPLVRSFILSNKKGKEAWVKPIIENDNYRFEVRVGKQPEGEITGTVQRTGATCFVSNSSMPFSYVRDEGQAGRMGERLLAIVAEGKRGRLYLSPTKDMERIARSATPAWKPEHKLPVNPRDFKTPNYGLTTFGDLFTPRQLVSLTTLSDLIIEVRNKIIEDCKSLGLEDDGINLEHGGRGVTAYADGLAVFLTFVLDRCADFNNSLTGWRPGNEKIMYLFGRQAIPMVWDYGEANILENVVGGFQTNLEYQVKCILKLGSAKVPGLVFQADAANQEISTRKVVSTDPPYYDNIGYADLSDFFYVWMRRTLKSVYPSLLSTIAVPKMEELVATPYRHGNKESAENFFLDGMTSAMKNLAVHSHPAFPVTIYYAFKQSETKMDGTSSTGWETFLEAVIDAGFSIVGTWPLRSEQSSRMIGLGSNALASSVVLVCKKRLNELVTISRRDFQRELREKMPEALEAMIGGESGQTPIAPVDLAQASIGPGMAVFSQYDSVLNQDGSRMSVHDALVLINRSISEYLNPDSGNFDSDTLFCDDWFSQYGWSTSSFGDADNLARAKGTSVEGVAEAGVIASGAGKVRLLKWVEYPSDWDPRADSRTPVWEACHQLIRALNQHGEAAAGNLLARMPEQGEPIRQLAYHLYTLCERKKWAEDARAYNELIGSWHAIVAASHEAGHKDEQIGLEF